METTIDLSQKKEQAIAEAKRMYDYLFKIPRDICHDLSARTGIRVVAWEPDTRNMFMASIYEPPESSQFFAIEQVVRANLKGDYSSQNSRDTKKVRFSGCVSMMMEGIEISVSVFGLKEEENVAVAIVVLASISGLSNSQVIENIKYFKGELPECLEQKDHYLCEAFNLGMKNFSLEQNGEIHEACNAIRALLVVHASSAGIVSDNPVQTECRRISESLGEESEIFEHIHLARWGKLFQNKSWLQYLESAGNVDALLNGLMSNHLKTVIKYFPAETKGYLIPELIGR